MPLVEKLGREIKEQHKVVKKHEKNKPLKAARHELRRLQQARADAWDNATRGMGERIT